MKHFLCGLLVFLFAVGAKAQTKADEQAVQKLPQAFCDAWAKHDGHQLAEIMAEDVDFVTVAAVNLHGRADFEKFHTRLLSGRFKDGLMVMVAEKRNGTWVVVVAQNTNAMLGVPPELQDLKTPIPIPGTGEKPE